MLSGRDPRGACSAAGAAPTAGSPHDRHAREAQPSAMPERTPASPDHIESEWQFDAPALLAVERWLRAGDAAGGVAVGAPATLRLRDLYLDTRDRKIFRAGFALRIRRSGRRAEATLKAVAGREGGFAQRRELTQPLTAATPAGIFAARGPVTDLLRRFTRAREIVVLAEVRTTRRAFPLTQRGAAAGEVTLDRTLLVAPRGAGRRLLRVEVEAPAARLGALRPFIERLRAAGGLTPAAQSKYEWALGARAAPPAPAAGLGPTEVTADQGVGEVALAVLRKHFGAVLWHEPGTRLGEDPESLHDMRVGTRRMRAALRLFREALPPRDTERLRRELRELGQALGRVRDLDVQIEQVEAWRPALLTVPPAALDPLLARLRERRTAARAELIDWLDAARCRRLFAFLRGWLRRGPTRRSGGGEPVRSAGPRLIRRARRRALEQGRALTPASPPADYHRLRILGKRLRYALEFLEPVYGPPARVLIRALVEVQDILGLHQDAQVAMATLPALAREPGGELPEAARAAAAEVAQLYAAQAASLRGRLPAAFAKLSGKDWKELKGVMDAAVAELAAEVLEQHVSRARGRSPRGAGTGARHGDPGRPSRHRRGA